MWHDDSGMVARPEPHASPPAGASDFFEDMPVGQRLDLGTHTFTRDEIVDFACSFDPQPFHMDEEAAAQSELGRLAASGWHTVAIWMRLYVRYRTRLREALAARNLPAARPGPSPGFSDMRWRKPVHPGDTIAYASTVTGKRRLGRRDWGLIQHRSTGTNQHGHQVLEFSGSVLWEKRPSVALEAHERAHGHVHVA